MGAPDSTSGTQPVRVIGIDPGTRVVGWGVVETDGARYRPVAHGAVRANARASIPERLVELAAGVRAAIAAHGPQEAAIEEAFHGRDAAAALRIGEARGALVVVLAEAGLPVTSYTNNVVKKAVTGAGRASKTQVQTMVGRILGLAEAPTPFDAADGLAVALCHLQRRGATPDRGGLSPRLARALRAAGVDPRRGTRRR